MSDVTSWSPTATRALLELRAQRLALARAFFTQHHVLEVDTPIMVNAPVTDPHLHPASVSLPGVARTFYLHTSPEYAMKRLLASGSGDIYQICHVMRGDERGRLHNAEFTLIEWYRLGFSLERLMDETEALVRALLGAVARGLRSERISYREAFKRSLGLDPLRSSAVQLRAAARAAGFDPPRGLQGDPLLDFCMAMIVGPSLGSAALTCVHGYPATQAALARLDPADGKTALRFELYCSGLELANGFHELSSAREQRERFERDLAERHRQGLPALPVDERLLAALEAGLPDCSGVALGFDRVLMLAANVDHIDQVLPFPIERA